MSAGSSQTQKGIAMAEAEATATSTPAPIDERVEALRAEMAKENVQAYIIPTEDPHMVHVQETLLHTPGKCTAAFRMYLSYESWIGQSFFENGLFIICIQICVQEAWRLPVQSEYSTANAERRHFITRFTGSAGTAVVTKDAALLWTDGRYFLQVADLPLSCRFP